MSKIDFLNRYKNFGLSKDEIKVITDDYLNKYSSSKEEIIRETRHSMRVNTLKITEVDLIKRLRAQKITLTKIPYLKLGYDYKSEFSLASTSEYLQGYFYLQESASQIPAEVLDPRPEEKILDMCAAPGSKTTYVAQLMNNKGVLVALDNASNRLDSLKDNLARLGIKNAILFRKDARFAYDLGLKFDRVLLDAPCSGNYTIDCCWFRKKDLFGIRERSKLQKELLKSAFKCLKPGGILVYSTCSLEIEENELNVNWFLNKYTDSMKLLDCNLKIGDPGLTNYVDKDKNKVELSSELKKTRRFWPHKAKTQGFYIAKFQKSL